MPQSKRARGSPWRAIAASTPRRCARISCRTDGRFDERRATRRSGAIGTGLFDKVTIERAGERLLVHLTEPRARPRRVRGQQEDTGQELTAVIESNRAHAAARHGTGRRRRIMEAYRHAGRDDAAWSLRSSAAATTGRLVYVVKEGAKTTVRQINFVGTRFSATATRRRDQDSATNVLSFLTGGDVTTRTVSQRIASNCGFTIAARARDASVPSAKVEYDPATQGFTLTFSIDEGPLYHFGDINIVCNVPGLDPETTPSAGGAIQRGIRRRRAGQDQRSFRDRAGKTRFPFAQTQPRTTRDAAASA